MSCDDLRSAKSLRVAGICVGDVVGRRKRREFGRRGRGKDE